MPSVQIKAVPEDVHAELRRRAANEGKPLQEYLLGRLIDEARRPDLDALLARAGQRSGGRPSERFADVVGVVHGGGGRARRTGAAFTESLASDRNRR